MLEERPIRGALRSTRQTWDLIVSGGLFAIAKVFNSPICNLHLRLLGHVAIEGGWIVRLREAIIHVVKQIDARGAGRGAVIVAAGIVT